MDPAIGYAISPSMHGDLAALVRPRAQIRCLATALQFATGPVWHPTWGSLVFSDAPAGILYSWRAGTGVSILRKPSGHAWGTAIDAAGRLIACEQGTRVVSRWSPQAGRMILVRTVCGARLNGPRGVLVHGDGGMWFSDPPSGLRGDEEQIAHLVHLPPGSRTARAVVSDCVHPDSLCSAPEQGLLYLAERLPGGRHVVRRFAHAGHGELSGGSSHCLLSSPAGIGMCCDADGRLWCGTGSGVEVVSSAGTPVGGLECGEPVTGCCFGGTDRRTLFLTTISSLWQLEMCVQGPAGA